jgi:hypothetical protein
LRSAAHNFYAVGHPGEKPVLSLGAFRILLINLLTTGVVPVVFSAQKAIV